MEMFVPDTNLGSHTQTKRKKTDHLFSDVTASTTNVVVEHECEMMDAPGVVTPHVQPAAKIPYSVSSLLFSFL